MKLTITLLAVAVAASGNAGELKVLAEHSGGFSDRVQWRIRMAGDHINVFASDAARNGTFGVTDEQRRQLVLLLDETRFFALKARYGMGDMEGNSCTMTILLGEQKSTVTLVMYSKNKPPDEAESSEVQRAYRVWDAVKALGRLADLPDDCRREFNIWDIRPK